MSINLYVYTGPFFQPPTAKVEMTDEKYACETGCTNSRRPVGSFCSTCGKPVNHVVSRTMVERTITPDDLDGDWVDVVAVVRVEEKDPRWLPNKRGFGLTIDEFGNQDVAELSAEKITQDTAKFVNAYKSIADAVMTKFGVELKVSYGVVPYMW